MDITKSLISLPTLQECGGQAILENAVELNKGQQAFKPATQQ